MDRVRLGRVLGRGARRAARTVYDALDAATTPAAATPTPARAPARPAAPPLPSQLEAANATPKEKSPAHPAPVRRKVEAPLKRALQGAAQAQGAAAAARRGIFAPVRRASRSLALEMTGSFFALFALSFCVAVWRTRGQWHNPDAHGRPVLYVLLAAIFLYFATSNFVKASRIQRG